MVIGIITGSQGKERRSIFSFLRYRKLREHKDILGSSELILLEAVCRGKYSEKKTAKGRKRLENRGCSTILKERCIKTQSELYETEVLKNKIFFELAFKLYKEYIKRLELKAYRMKLLIIDKKCSAVSKAAVERLSFYSAKCEIITDNIKKAEDISEYSFRENGFFVSVSSEGVQSGFDAVIDMDSRTLKIAGKIFIKRFEFEAAKLFEFDIDGLEAAEALEKAGFKICYTKTVGNTAYFEIK